jgi:hypothetical protein
MNTTEAEIRLSQLRICIFLTMAAVGRRDLSAASTTYAIAMIRHDAFQACQSRYSDDVINEAAARVAACLSWTEPAECTS